MRRKRIIVQSTDKLILLSLPVFLQHGHTGTDHTFGDSMLIDFAWASVRLYRVLRIAIVHL
jgi:hypothetical protein